MDLEKSMMVSAAGLRAQSLRMRVIAENMANQDSVAASPDENPYRRKLVSFSDRLNNELGVNTVGVKGVTYDKSEFGRRFEPGHPAADPDGYIRTTNVNGLIEAMDMRQAQRTYQANIRAIEAAKNMMLQTVEILR